jgi:hypothetical protein
MKKLKRNEGFNGCHMLEVGATGIEEEESLLSSMRQF